MSKILIIRFSALGDVAMTIPVIYSFAKTHKEHAITVLSELSFEPLFANKPENVQFLGLDLKSKRMGISDIRKFYVEKLRPLNFDFVADFHSVIRTHLIGLNFRLDGIKVAVIKKDRKRKHLLTRKQNKTLIQLDSSFNRYKNVLEKLAFEFDLSFKSLFEETPANTETIISSFPKKENNKWIGIAPFAKHKGKIYPLELQERVINHFSNSKNIKIIVFGGGKHETDIINNWLKKYPDLLTTAGKFSMADELIIMSRLDLMISMDSANMHLASLVNTKVLSIWGATHPYAGFLGWNQSINNTIQIDLPCRPCSVYGNKECFRKDYACMYGIQPETIIEKTENLI